MKRLHQQMTKWRTDNVPTLVGGDFNVIPEDIDCHKPSSWERDALFQPEPRAAYRALLGLGYTDAFRSLHVGEGGISLSGITSGRLSYTTEAYASIIFCCRPRSPSDSKNVRSINVREPSKNHPITLP